MKRFLKILLLLLPLFYFGQQNKYDSLKQALRLATTDSAQFDLLFNLATNQLENNFDTALYYIEQAIPIAQKNKMALDEASALSTKGYILMHLGRLPGSFQCFMQALPMAENLSNEKKSWDPDAKAHPRYYRLRQLADIHHNLGHLMGTAGKVDQQILQYKETQKIAESLQDTTLLGFVNMNLGSVYLANGNNLDSALQMEKNAEHIFQTRDKRYLGSVYSYIADIYRDKKNDSLALAYFHKGIAVNLEQNHLAGVAGIYAGLANFYLNKKNKDSSLYYAIKTLDVDRSINNKWLGYAYSNLYKAYQLNNNRDSAYKYQGLALVANDSAYTAGIKNLTGVQNLSFNQQLQLQQLEKERTETQNKIRTYALLAGLGVLLIIGLILFRNNQQKQKANQVLQTTLSNLKATQAQLIQSEKMASLGELTAGIAHEIQNPLNFVNNFSEVNTELIEEMKTELQTGNTAEAASIADEVKENNVKINHHGKRADAIVKSMLEHSRTAKGDRQPIDINALCDEYLRLSYHGFRAKDKSFNATIETNFDAQAGLINLVPQDIGRVLLNLFNNAFYAVHEQLKKLGEGYEPTVMVTTKKLQNKIEVRVQDNGMGISKSSIDKIFQPFFTTKPTGKGTGLGLSLSYDIIKAHGGELRVESEEGKGSVFVIELPYSTR